tara:strand:- start:401 stop:514 length:114 start_codon:yes stop_codon:yes gene_type:complete
MSTLFSKLQMTLTIEPYKQAAGTGHYQIYDFLRLKEI